MVDLNGRQSQGQLLSATTGTQRLNAVMDYMDY